MRGCLAPAHPSMIWTVQIQPLSAEEDSMPQTEGSSDDEGTQQAPLELNTNVPQSARVYDYWLGGKDNFPADQAMAEAIAEQVPTIRTQVREQRAFLRRTVRYLTGEAGIRQFLDIGTGIPSAGNLVLSQTTPDFDPEAMRGLAAVSEQGGIPNVPRTFAETEPFFAGLELVEPGLVPILAWRPDPGLPRRDPRSVYVYGGVARKP